MKFQTSLSVLAILATSQLIHAQEAQGQQQQDDTASVQTINNEAPALEADVPDIYWWKSLLTEEELANYLTEPADTAAGATDSAAAAPTPAATPASDNVSSDAANDATDASSTASSTATATGADASTAVSGASASATGVADAATDASSTGAASAWSSSSSAGSTPVATSAMSQSAGAPKPSGGSIPPSTSSNAVNHTSMATQTNIDISRVLFSAVAVSAALFKFLN